MQGQKTSQFFAPKWGHGGIYLYGRPIWWIAYISSQLRIPRPCLRLDAPLLYSSSHSDGGRFSLRIPFIFSYFSFSGVLFIFLFPNKSGNCAPSAAQRSLMTKRALYDAKKLNLRTDIKHHILSWFLQCKFLTKFCPFFNPVLLPGVWKRPFDPFT